MTDFKYKGVLITENWPASARMRGAARPSYERWTATFNDLTTLNANSKREIKAVITATLQQVAA